MIAFRRFEVDGVKPHHAFALSGSMSDFTRDSSRWPPLFCPAGPFSRRPARVWPLGFDCLVRNLRMREGRPLLKTQLSGRVRRVQMCGARGLGRESIGHYLIESGHINAFGLLPCEFRSR